MAQLTIRADGELVERVKRAAADSRRSMNEFVTSVLDAATDPDLAGDEVERLRARLRAAGLLAEMPRARGRRPDPAEVAAAGRRAARGTPLSEIVVGDR